MTIHRKVWQSGDPRIPIGTQTTDSWQGIESEGETNVVTHSDPEGTGPGPESIGHPRPVAPTTTPGREPHTASRRVQVLNGLGFHLRPIERFVKIVQSYRAEVEVRYEGRRCNGRSMLDLMSLAAECGTEIELEAAGEDAQKVLDVLAALFAARFHEDDLGQPLPLQENAP